MVVKLSFVESPLLAHWVPQEVFVLVVVKPVGLVHLSKLLQAVQHNLADHRLSNHLLLLLKLVRIHKHSRLQFGHSVHLQLPFEVRHFQS
jgi:hypothetical protein